MDIIPVIDVQHGAAVRASRGQRAAYRPLTTPLADGSDPLEVALGLRSLFAFPVLYVADLDGIEGRGRNAGLPERLAAALPGVEVWIDDGTPVGAVPGQIGQTLGVVPVVGSEGLESEADVAALRALPKDGYILSLDFRGDRFDGPSAVVDEAEHWPDRVIVMTLARVGSAEGPDLGKVTDAVARAGERRVLAAGGVRDCADIEALKGAGASGVLVASALHSGAITAGDLERFAGR